MSSLFKKASRFFLRPAVALFDFKKKRDMERLYGVRGDHWGRSGNIHQIDAAIAFLGGRRYRNALDIGAGEGFFVEALASACDHVTAIDISENAVMVARKRLAHIPNITFFSENIRTWETSDRFDLIILADVLYYLGDTLFPEVFAETVRKITLLANDEGDILLTHFLAPWRDEHVVDKIYVKAFADAGFPLLQEEVYQHTDGSWKHLLFRRDVPHRESA